MTIEEKQLLLKDLCARLPYHPKINIYNDSWEGCQIGEFDNELWYHHIEAFNCDRIEIIPYLRPMSSMTADEQQKYYDLTHQEEDDIWGKCLFDKMVDFCNKNHLDYRGLIEKGLAIEAPEEIYEKGGNK